MYIKEIDLNNFRIYKGKNKISLLPDSDKNIIIISGKNGSGKSTFLNLITGAIPADSGIIEVGQTTKYGYYRQEGIAFNPQQGYRRCN